MNEKILKLPDLMSEMAQREEGLNELEIKLRKLSTIQDDKVEKLWKGYALLGLLDGLDKDGVAPITREMYNVELEKIVGPLNELLGYFNSNPKDKKARDEAEKLIVELLALMNIRVQSIFKFKKLWNDRRQEFKQSEINLLDQYKELLSIKDTVLFKTKTEKVGMMQVELIEKQLVLITAEEELYNELEMLCNVREHLFDISSELFKI